MDLPSLVDAAEMTELGGSPFFLGVQLMGDRGYFDFAARSEGLQSLATTDWPRIQRLFGYYESAQWEYFDGELGQLAGEPWAPSHPWDRDDTFHRILDTALAPAWTTRPHYPELKASLWSKLRPPRANMPAVVAYARESSATERFTRDRRSLFEGLDIYVRHLDALIPAIPLELMEDPPAELRIMRDDFTQLRDMYLQGFEACHRGLEYVLGAANAAEFGDPQDFGGGGPASLNAFRSLTAARKADVLRRRLPDWADLWSGQFNRTLRNAIGHASARHDLRTGEVQTDRGDTISYADFVKACLRLVSPLLLLLNLQKLLAVYSQMGGARGGTAP